MTMLILLPTSTRAGVVASDFLGGTLDGFHLGGAADRFSGGAGFICRVAVGTDLIIIVIRAAFAGLFQRASVRRDQRSL